MSYQGGKPIQTAQPGHGESALAKNLRASGDASGNLDKVIAKGVASVKQQPLDAKMYPPTHGHHKAADDGTVPGATSWADHVARTPTE